MKVRGDLPPSNAFSLEAQPKKPGFALVRFYEHVEPFEETRGDLTISGFEYDEYHLELPDIDGLQDDVLNNFNRYIIEAKAQEKPTAQDLKIAELKQVCNAAITGGIAVETSQGSEHFSLTPEDQINIQNLALQIAAGAPGALYHADGALCRRFAAEEIGVVTESAVRHVTYHTTYFNHLKAWVERTNDPVELQGIFYGANLPEDLKEHMNALLSGEDGA